MAGILYQDQGGAQPVFIGAAGRKTTSYEANYHSSKGELAALNFALQKFQHLLLQGEFLVKTDNTTVSNWATSPLPPYTRAR